MIGTTLKNLLDEREIKVNEFARQIKVPAQTLYSIIRRDNMKIDFELLRSGRCSGSCAVWMITAAL